VCDTVGFDDDVVGFFASGVSSSSNSRSEWVSGKDRLASSSCTGRGVGSDSGSGSGCLRLHWDERRFNSLVVGGDVGSGKSGVRVSSVISGIAGQKSSGDCSVSLAGIDSIVESKICL
jgi:hypothetical protein